MNKCVGMTMIGENIFASIEEMIYGKSEPDYLNQNDEILIGYGMDNDIMPSQIGG